MAESNETQNEGFTEEELAAAVATPDLAFKGGVLHQRVIVNREGASLPAWRQVPEIEE